MSPVAAHQPPSPSHVPGRGSARVAPALAWGLHVLVLALLVIAAGRSVLDEEPGWPWVVASAALVGAVYALGSRMPASASPRTVGWWLAVLLGTWGLLLFLTPDAIYLAFAWFFLLLHLLPRLVALATVLLTTAAAVAGFAWHRETFTAAMVIGPVLGAAVAVVVVFGYQALRAESEQRRLLIIELDRTRDELAAVQHREGVLDERERLAREIHDTLAQGLSSIQLLLQAANRSLDPKRGIDAARAAGLVEQARQAAHDNLLEARRVVRALSPGDLEQSTLAAALQRLCATTTARTGIAVTFHLVGPTPTLDTPVEVALLRIAQGALGNTAQHSGATRADVTLTSMDTAVTLDVVDDGQGFDPGSATATHPGDRWNSESDERGRPKADGGFGLRSMRSRACDLGAVLSVESRAGGGTAISVHVDMPAGRATLDGPARTGELTKERRR